MDHPLEFKANVEPPTIDDALSRLGLSDEDAQPRSIYFCSFGRDDPRPSLDRLGVILRLRRDVGSADSTLKLRPCVTAQLPPRWSTPSAGDGWEFRIEQDWSEGQDPVLSASLVAELDAADADAALSDEDVSRLFSTDQRGLFADYTGEPLDTTGLLVLGPVRARKWKVELDGRKVNCEEWVVGDRLRFLELSDREEDPALVAQTRRELLALCARLGVQISTVPQLKTQLVLDYFSQAPAAG